MSSTLTSLRAVAGALGGEVAGHHVVCPGPGHSKRDRSLKVWIGKDGAIHVHSFAGDDWRDCRDYVCERLGLPLFRPGERQAPPRPRLPPSPAERTDAERTAFAMRFWHAACSPVGTLAETCLALRGLHLPDDVLAGDSIRFHPRCPFAGKRLPCMVALFTDARTGEPRGIHRTAMTPDGRKIGHPIALGPSAGCVIRLWPDEVVEQGLVIGEGIETVLAAATRLEHRGTLLRPAWAAGSAGNMKSFPVLPGITALTILVDNDASGTGQGAAEKCAHRWRDAGRQVIRLIPFRHDSDFADLASET